MSLRKSVPFIAIGTGIVAIAASAFHFRDRIIDFVMPTKTGYHRVDQILGKLQAAALASGIPLGLLVGWVIAESGGKITSTTKLNELGFFQLMPAESKALGLDHERLSTDVDYSIDGGIKLIQSYMTKADALGIGTKGTSFYWRMVKLLHTMGTGAVDKVVALAKQHFKSFIDLI
jgi:hypothetical protein